MMAIKQVENTTANPIILKYVGITLPANTTVLIEPVDYFLWAKLDNVAEVTSLINSGDLVISDGTQDLTPTEGINYIGHPNDTADIRLTIEGVDTLGDFGAENDLTGTITLPATIATKAAGSVVRVSKDDAKYRFLEDKILPGPGINIVKETDGVTGEETLKLDSTSSFEGKGFQTTFLGNGTVKNTWLENEDSDIESNQTPDIFKFNARLVGIDFTNQNNNADPIILIAISNAGNDTSIDRSYKWTLTDIRVASKSHKSLDFTVNAGDKMAIYVQDGGGDSNDVVISMDFIATDAADQEITENYSGNFSSGDFPALGSIPEILE